VPPPRAPEGILSTTSAKLPPPLRHFQPGIRGEGTQAGLRILFPPDGARIELRMTDEGLAPVPLKVVGAVAPLAILVNGMPASPQTRGNLFFQPKGPGFARLTVIDGRGAVDSVLLRLETDSSAMTVSAAR
jgi:penicillin-binding protein 1C